MTREGERAYVFAADEVMEKKKNRSTLYVRSDETIGLSFSHRAGQSEIRSTARRATPRPSDNAERASSKCRGMRARSVRSGKKHACERARKFRFWSAARLRSAACRSNARQ